MEYEQIRQSAKMRLCRALSSAVLAPLQDGIEKVRGSTPLISTTLDCVQIQGFPRFLVCAVARPDGAFWGVLIHFKTSRTGLPETAESVRTNEDEANGVGLGQPRPLVLLGEAAGRKDAAERAAQGSQLKPHDADGSPAQDGRRRRRAVLGGTHAASRTA